MQKNIYLWVEDRVDKAGFTFWKTMMEQLFAWRLLGDILL